MRLLIISLLWSCCASAQITDSSIVKTVDLPAAEPFDTSRVYYWKASHFIYLSSDNDLYSYFGYEIAMKYREFNFSDYHILGELNDKKWTWTMRENKMAFTEVPVIIVPGYTGVPDNRRFFYMDSVIKAATDTGQTKWYNTGNGDCHAMFDYKLYTDNYHPVLLLKEWNYWGGCRAAGSRDHTLSFSMPPGILYTIKNTLLMDGHGKLR